MLKKLIIAFAIIFFASIGNQSIALVAVDEIAPEINPKDIVHYAIAMHGEPKYKSDFTHLEYANPDAIKGGVLNLSAIGGFDSLNPHILKGNAASGITMVYQTIL